MVKKASSGFEEMLTVSFDNILQLEQTNEKKQKIFNL